MGLFRSNKDVVVNAAVEANEALLAANSVDNVQRGQGPYSGNSGSNYTGDTFHDIGTEYGYPEELTFSMFWNMYRRFGIASNIVELSVDTCWSTSPTVEGVSESDFDRLQKKLKLWSRLKGLDQRQRVGRYGGLFMRVKDNLTPENPIAGKMSGIESIESITPLYESQLEVLNVETNTASVNYGQPTMYQFSSAAVGDNNDNTATTFKIHPDRIVIWAEGADDGSIFGQSVLEAPYNSLMDLRKIIGAGGEGFYKNAAQNVVFELTDASSAKANANLLTKFSAQISDFMRNRMKRALWTPGLKPSVLNASLAQPKEFFEVAMADVAAAVKLPATIIIGQQTGRLASDEDSRQFAGQNQTRRENFLTDATSKVIDWFMEWGILAASDFEIEWDDLRARSDEEKIASGDQMAAINQKQFQASQPAVFTPEEIRDASGFDTEPEGEISEALPEEE